MPTTPEKSLTIALSGNPNAGKTSIFNHITGTRQKVGNWPGVTVEKKEGTIRKHGYELRIVDLPGTYSLTPFSIEEIIARDFILEESPDVVVVIIDSSNLERSLYLATQIRELDCKVVFCLNMADVSRSRGIKIDATKLSELLDVPVLFTVGNKNDGIDDLLKAAIELAESDGLSTQKRKVRYRADIEKAIKEVEAVLVADLGSTLPYNTRWASIKLIEDDTIVKKRVQELTGEKGDRIFEAVQLHRETLMGLFDEDPEILTTDERYGFIAGIVKEVHTTAVQQRVDISRNIDLVLTNRFVGFPIFILFIWIMFQSTFTLGAYPMQWLEAGIGVFSGIMDSILPDSLIKELLLEGVIAGVGSVIVFLPNILILFFCISLFEDTGYMSRAAFLMDKIMHLIGLHGKSFIPMLMGFGCNVPAIMAARTLESEKDRILTILITPFMSCSAKLPVYIVLAGAFFGPRAGTVIFLIYLLGIVLSIVTGRLFRSVLLKGADAPFVMELPPYRVPMFKSLMIHMWDRSKLFLKKMGGIILIGSVVVWCLTAFPRQVSFTMDYDAEIERIEQAYQAFQPNPGTELAEKIQGKKDREIQRLKMAQAAEKAENSFMGRIGTTIAPFFQPLGIEWKGGVALLTGFVAKEIVVSTLGVLYAANDASEPDALKKALLASNFTPLSAFAMMIFVLLYMPCLATVAAIRRETRSIRWMLFSIVYTTSVAWIMSFVVYQGGKMLGFA
ncbi:MAG: ferrous iron transport protein B [Desulfobacterales bacterium]|nr:ferrous iron transport protein B [Desulfobacterales bacterium]MDX2511834.1 ferrous iron transport protein B [Desulfobacterales bacterium]